MKKLFPLFACCVIVYSCKNKTTFTQAVKADSTDAAKERPVKLSEINGLWTGVFTISAAEETLRNKAQDFQKAYFKKKYNADFEDGYDGDLFITDLKEIPVELRKAYYLEPLNGYYSIKQPNKVSVIITGINDSGQVIGRSICAGNERVLKGSYSKTGNGFTAVLKEPGDDKNDGTFNLKFLLNADIASGTWTSLSGDKKGCDLKKKDFVYAASNNDIILFQPQNNDGGYLEFKKNPSMQILTTKDIENLTKPELTILRNLIYARHGYAFASASLRNYFEREEWYIPFKKDIRSDLTELEKKNADKLKSFEQYASSAYDEFGR